MINRRTKKFVFLVIQVSGLALNIRLRAARGSVDPRLILLTLRVNVHSVHTHSLAKICATGHSCLGRHFHLSFPVGSGD